MIDELVDSQEWPGRNKEIEIDFSEENKKTVSIKATQEQLSKPKEFGIDIEALLTTTLYDEAMRDIQHSLNQSSFNLNVNGTEEHIFDNIKDLQKILKLKTGFAVVNTQIGVALQSSPVMVITPTTKMIASTGGRMYQIGTFKDVRIFVDPYMGWNDNRCSIIENLFYNFLISDDCTVNVDGVKAPEIVVSYYLNSIPPDNTIITIKSEEPLI